MTRPSWQDFGTHDESAVPELWDGVVGAWAPCLGPTGSRLHDMSRRSNWGTLTNMDNATDWVVSDGQYALDFDGSNDSVKTNFILPNLSSYTLATWIWIHSLPSSGQIHVLLNTYYDQSAIVFGFDLRIRNDAGVNKIGVYGGNGTSGFGGSDEVYTLPTQQWIHVVARRNNTGGACFLNGTQITTHAGLPAAVMNVNKPLSIGSFGAFNSPGAEVGRWFNGQMADVAVYNCNLAPNEIRQLYQLGRGGMYQRRRRRAIYLPQAGFQAAWALRRSQIIGGGLR